MEEIKECPYCKSSNVESKGMRNKGESNESKRYHCNDCNKSFARYVSTQELVTKEKSKEMIREDKVADEKVKMTSMSISQANKKALEKLKVIEYEPLDSVLSRVLGTNPDWKQKVAK